MRIHKIYREQKLPISVEQAWSFFSSPQNLSHITPPEMNFKIISSLGDMGIYDGMQIHYYVSPLFHIPLKWITEIKTVQAPSRFVDTQFKGPYSLWEHTHVFKEITGGVLMTDEVKYALPLGWLGELAHVLVAKKKAGNNF